MEAPWQIAGPLDARLFADVKHAAIFECCKWDPQIEDVCTLSPLPLVLTPAAWRTLASMAERLAREAAAAETAILREPRLFKQLGLPRPLRRRLCAPGIAGAGTRHQRLIRFDFHHTTEGWRISEANTDVPGGFNEASGFTKLMARHYGRTSPAGDPTGKIAAAIGEAIGKPGTVALVHATAFADDRQAMVYLARRLQEAGHRPVLAAPDHLRWENGKAFLTADWARGPVDFVFRFFPAEWLPLLPRKCAWPHLLGDSQTPLCNPALALISQSKRFPLVWNELPFRMPAWEALLPATFELRDARRRGLAEESLVFKPIFGRVGDMIKMHGVTPEKDLRAIHRSIRRHPELWIAQQRFDAVPLPTPSGDVFPCIGVYTLNGTVIGAYGRIARRPLINHLAQDAAVLISEPVPSSIPNPNIPDETLRNLQTVGA